MAQQPVELILARNLISGTSLAAVLMDPDGVVIFFNEAAGDLIGRRFEDVGRMTRDQWNSEFGPFDESGEVIPSEDLPVSIALREGLPANGRVHVRARDDLIEVEVSALPLTTADGFKGAIVVFWRDAE
jgi:PAS domain-containing protein